MSEPHASAESMMTTIYESQQSVIERSGDPHYIVIEGPDGVGKTTLIKALQDGLQRYGVTHDRIFTVSFPSKVTTPGRIIREIFTDIEFIRNPRTMLYLMLADLTEWESSLPIHDLLADKAYIIADRHPLVSNFAYQGEAYAPEAIHSIQYRQQFIEPHRIFILDAPPDVQEQRIQERSEKRNVMFEKKSARYQERLRQRYLGYALSNPHNCVLLDATQSIPELLDTVLMSVLRGGVQ